MRSVATTKFTPSSVMHVVMVALVAALLGTVWSASPQLEDVLAEQISRVAPMLSRDLRATAPSELPPPSAAGLARPAIPWEGRGPRFAWSLIRPTSASDFETASHTFFYGGVRTTIAADVSTGLYEGAASAAKRAPVMPAVDAGRGTETSTTR